MCPLVCGSFQRGSTRVQGVLCGRLSIAHQLMDVSFVSSVGLLRIKLYGHPLFFFVYCGKKPLA